MALTGQLGVSQYGDLVLGVTSLSNGFLGFEPHVISANEIRIAFTLKVDETALDIDNYNLITTESLGIAIVPNILTIEFDDATQRSIVISLDQNLTYNKGYSIELDNVYSISDEFLSLASKNFTANVPAPPKAIGAWLSKRGFVDILFDKPVGNDSSGASFFIRDADDVGPSIPAAQTPWATEQISEDTLRVSLPPTTPTASSHAIDYSDVMDDSLNTGGGSVRIDLALRSDPPYSLSKLTQFQLIDAFVVGGDFEFFRFGIVRIYYSSPSNVDTNFPETQFSFYESGPHPIFDDANIITSPNAISEASLVTLCNEIKNDFNNHLTQEGVHLRIDNNNIITATNPVNTATCIDFLNEVQPQILNHIQSNSSHIYSDVDQSFSVISVSNLAMSNSVANTIKNSLNKHFSVERSSSILTISAGILNKTADHSKEPTSAYDVRSPYTYFTDFHIRLNSSKSTVRIEANLTSQDTASSATSSDFTGNIVARSYEQSFFVHSKLAFTDEALEIKVTGNAVLPNQKSLSIHEFESGRELNAGNISITSSLPLITSNINYLIVAFNNHVSQGALTGVHLEVDSYNRISFGVNIVNITNVIAKANELKTSLNSHIRNEQSQFHSHMDPQVIEADDADDFDSLVLLVDSIRKTFIRHNLNGPHSIPNFLIYNGSFFDTIRMPIPNMKNDKYELKGRLFNESKQIPSNGELGKFYPHLPGSQVRYLGEDILTPINVSEEFDGNASLPVVASALPKSGLDFDDNGFLVFETDQIRVFFSKPMSQAALDVSNLAVTGGSIIQKETYWVNDREAVMQVINMESIPYTVSATNLTDKAGNLNI